MTGLEQSIQLNRGFFCAFYDKKKNKLAFFLTSTTVEFMTYYVCYIWKDELNSAEADIVFLSEGLSKGGYMDKKNRVSA